VELLFPLHLHMLQCWSHFLLETHQSSLFCAQIEVELYLCFVCSLVDCRCHFEPTLPECVMGNYVSGIPQTQQVKENMTFWDVARAVSSTTEKESSKYRHFSELPVINLLFSQVSCLHPSKSILHPKAFWSVIKLARNVDNLLL